jgi:hypothetical protein
MKKTERFVHLDDAGGGGIQPRMVRELRTEMERIRADWGPGFRLRNRRR